MSTSTLRIKLNPYKDYNTAALDDRPFSSYSELCNFMKEPFLNWADKLLETAEREINDNYTLVVTGEVFEKMLLADMQNEFDACQSYGTDDYAINYSAGERYQMILQLAKKYGVKFNLANYRMNVASDYELPSNVSFALTPSDISNALLIVTRDLGVEKTILGKRGPCIAVVISSQSTVRSLGNARYIWEITEDRLSEVLSAIVDRFVKVPFIVSIANELSFHTTEMGPEDREKLALITEIDMFLSISDIPNIEVGNTYELEVKTIPENSAIPSLIVESSNPAVVTANGNCLIAMSPGQAIIKIYRQDEIIPFAEKEVFTFQNNYVKEINLNADDTMGINKSQTIEMNLIPADAEDADQIVWSSSDDRVAMVDKSGIVRSLSAGDVTITAKSKQASSSFVIKVLPNIEEMKASINKARLYVGDTKPIDIKITPMECFDDRCIWKSSNSKVAIVEITEDGKTVIRATGVGDCVLTCTAIEGGCSVSCDVKVEATFKKREKNSVFLGLSLFCAVVAIFCTFFSIPIGVLIGGGLGVVFGVIAIIVNWRDCVWALIFMGICALLLLNHFGIVDIMSLFK